MPNKAKATDWSLSSPPWRSGAFVSEYEEHSLEEDAGFQHLLSSLDEYAKASERSARRSFICAVLSLIVGAISATAAVLAILF